MHPTYKYFLKKELNTEIILKHRKLIEKRIKKADLPYNFSTFSAGFMSFHARSNKVCRAFAKKGVFTQMPMS
jgi:hypothetical protein